MSFTFKWPSRKKPSSSARSRTAVARKPRGKEALSARKPASGWTIKLTGLKTSLAQIAEGDGDDYNLGLQAAYDALPEDGFSDAFVEGFLDGVMEMLPGNALAK